MQRTLYAYKISIHPVSDKKPLNVENFEEDFMDAINALIKKGANERKHDFKQDKKVLYLDDVDYHADERIVNLKFVSAKYDARRQVIDTDTLADKGIPKKEHDGDKEKNHIGVKFVSDTEAVCLAETNYYGIGFGKIVRYLQNQIKAYHREKKDGCYYNLGYKNIVSKDFIKSLEQIRRIKAVTLTVDQEEVKVSEFKAASGRADVSSDVDIVMKPSTPGVGIFKNTVKEFWDIYNDKKYKVKRVTVDGDGDSKESLSFDTEQMKMKMLITVEPTSDTGEVDTGDMYDKLFVEILQL